MTYALPTMPKTGLLALFLSLALAPWVAHAQEPQAAFGSRGITGTWNHQLTIRDCATGAVIATSFPTSSYLDGGAVVEVAPLPGPTLRTPSLGVWRYVGGQKYEMAMQYFRYNADGSYAGKTIIEADITHQPDDTLTQAAAVRIFNATGVQVASGCATVTSTRFTGAN